MMGVSQINIIGSRDHGKNLFWEKFHVAINYPYKKVTVKGFLCVF